MARPPNDITTNDVFTEWMKDHRGIVIKIVRSFTARPADTEDLTQEIDLAIWRSIPSFQGDAKPSTWIWRIAMNRAISWQRAADEQHAGLDVIAEPAGHERADSGVKVDRIFDAIRTLAPLDRMLIVLSLEGYRYAEIADLVGLTETNVGARLSRARTRLNQLLEDTEAKEEVQ